MVGLVLFYGRKMRRMEGCLTEYEHYDDDDKGVVMTGVGRVGLEGGG